MFQAALQMPLSALFNHMPPSVGGLTEGKSAPAGKPRTTNDFLMNGSGDEVVSAQLTDKELLNLFKEVEKLNQEDKYLIKTFIDAFLTKPHIQKLTNT